MRKHETWSNCESCVGFISLTFLWFSSTLMCIEHYLTVLAALLLLLLLYKQVVDVNPHRLVECSTVKLNYNYE